MTKKSSPPSKKKPYNAYLKYSGIGFQMLAIILMGVGIGYFLDSRCTVVEDLPLFTTIFSLLFVGIAIWVVVRELIKES